MATDLPDFTDQTSVSSIVATDVTILAGQSGTDVSVNQPPYVIGSYTDTGSGGNQTSPAMNLKAGTHAVLVVCDAASGASKVPITFQVQSATNALPWPLLNVPIGNALLSTTVPSQHYVLGMAFLIDTYDPQVAISFQPNGNNADKYTLYGILDTTLILPLILGGTPSEVKGDSSVSVSNETGVLRVQGPTGSHVGAPIIVGGSRTGQPSQTPSYVLASGSFNNGAQVVPAPPTGQANYYTAIFCWGGAQDTAIICGIPIHNPGASANPGSTVLSSPVVSGTNGTYNAQTVNQALTIVVIGFQQ